MSVVNDSTSIIWNAPFKAKFLGMVTHKLTRKKVKIKISTGNENKQTLPTI
jgi:hypothetical protein